MRFAMFYEIPVAQPWDPDSEYRAYQETIEQAKLGDRMGFHSFWTVEHHFLDEYSHCSNPEVLYGHIAAVTENLRIGYGVRLMPAPYNHPVRTAESVATLDLISDGRVEFGTGRSSTRAELEGFGVDPHVTREMWDEAIRHVVGCWTNDEYEFEGQYWSMPRRRVHPKPRQRPHPPIWSATSSLDGHYEVGVRGLGLLSFTVGQPPEELRPRVENYKRGIADCKEPIGAFVNDQVATFTLVHCNDTDDKARSVAEESFVWYPKTAMWHIAQLAAWMKEGGDTEFGNYAYAGEALEREESGVMSHLDMNYMYDTGASIVGDPDRCIELCKRYEAVGCDVLFCLLNPYNIPHEEVMRSIELLGTHVIPEFAD